MLVIIILGLVILLIISIFLFKEKPNNNRFKITSMIYKILGILVLGIVVYSIINSLASDGIKSYYCLSDNKCVTVWKKVNGEKYIIFGRYESGEVPSDNYIRIETLSSDYVDVIFLNDKKSLIAVDDKADIVIQSSNNLIELYKENKVVNDSLYTYFDDRYRRYNKEIDFISLNIKENYATDKNGNKLN